MTMQVCESVSVTAIDQLPSVVTDPVEQLVADFFGAHKDATLRTYRQALRDFSQFLGVDSVDQAARVLLSRGPGPANQLVLQYRNGLAERKLSRATINLRLSAIRSLVRLARVVGLVPWTLEIRNVRTEDCRDCSGPGLDGVRRLLSRAREHRSAAHGARDVAMLRLMFDLGLRRGAVVSLDVENLDLDEGGIQVKEKGRTARTRRSLPDETKTALRRWLHYRGDHSGPLFVNFDRAQKGQRLSGRSVHRIVERIGRDLGLTVRPHGIRHTAVTTALELTGGDVRRVRQFSAHADIRTVLRYDDCRMDAAGEIARQVAAAL
jgi:integrase/recombinase XerC